MAKNVTKMSQKRAKKFFCRKFVKNITILRRISRRIRIWAWFGKFHNKNGQKSPLKFYFIRKKLKSDLYLKTSFSRYIKDIEEISFDSKSSRIGSIFKLLAIFGTHRKHKNLEAQKKSFNFGPPCKKLAKNDKYFNIYGKMLLQDKLV